MASTSGAASAGSCRASGTKWPSRAVNARPPDSGRGWIVTGGSSIPLMAVETNARPDGSSRNATGAPAISQAARQTARRASSPAASTRTTRPIAPIPRAWSRSVSFIRLTSRSFVSRSSS